MARFGRVITAMVTPFRADGSLDPDAAQALARHLVDHGSEGLVLAGSTGEGATLRDDEKSTLFRAVVDAEIGREGFSYALASGKEGTVHIDRVLEYNQDPEFLRDRLLYRLTLEAQRRVARSRLSRREIIRRLGTSATQFYRLLDQTNYHKSIDQLLSLLHVLDCDVDLVVRAKSA